MQTLSEFANEVPSLRIKLWCRWKTVFSTRVWCLQVNGKALEDTAAAYLDLKIIAQHSLIHSEEFWFIFQLGSQKRFIASFFCPPCKLFCYMLPTPKTDEWVPEAGVK